jgi:drug/metabolite transporter (DMT)-like permease
MRHRTGWQPLLEWAIAFVLAALAVITSASIGLFVWPFAIAALAVAARRNRPWPESLFGGLLGVAAVCLLVAYLNRANLPCPPLPDAMRIGPGSHGGCGGFDPRSWSTAGLALAAASLVGYMAFRHRHRGAAA